MTDQSAGQGAQGAPPAPGLDAALAEINGARAKLVEIANEKSLPEDAVTLFGQLLALCDRFAFNSQDDLDKINEIDERVDTVNEAARNQIGHLGTLEARVNEISDLVETLRATLTGITEGIAAPVTVAAGISGAPLVAAAALIAAGRANGAISGVTAEAFDHVLAALGYVPAPPANETPAPDGGGEEPSPAETSTETPTESTGGTEGSTETPAAEANTEGDAQPNPAEAGG